MMICTRSCGSYVQGLWWMYQSLARECFTSPRVTWNKYSTTTLFAFTVFVFLVSKNRSKSAFPLLFSHVFNVFFLVALLGFVVGSINKSGAKSANPSV